MDNLEISDAPLHSQVAECYAKQSWMWVFARITAVAGSLLSWLQKNKMEKIVSIKILRPITLPIIGVMIIAYIIVAYIFDLEM